MKLLEIYKKIKSGKIKLKDGIGHSFNPIDDSILSYYNWMKECSEDKEINPDNDKNINLIIISKDYNIGEIFLNVFGDGLYCFDCGNYYFPYLIDDSTLGLIERSIYFDLRKTNNDNNKKNGTDNKVILSDSDCSSCVILEDKIKGYLTSEIEIPSGNLVFKNYFSKEKIYEFPKNINFLNNNSINSTLGRKSLMQYLSTMNIGYGQMGNMSVTIFVKLDGSEIIIGTDCTYNEKDGEIIVKHKGYKKVGKISLSVWRWMCGDVDILRQHKEPISKELEILINNPKQVYSTHYEDELLVKVKSGKWVIEHYYEFQIEREIIYSRMYIKQDK